MRREKARNGLLPNSIKVISSCLKTVSSNAGSVASTVRSVGVTGAGSISLTAEEDKDQVLWVAFDKIQFSHTCFRRALLLGYVNGFQVLDVEDSSNIHELVSKHTGPVTYIQVLPVPALSEGTEEIRASHPLVSVVAGEETNFHQQVDYISIPTVVRFFSLKSHSCAHVLRFRSAVYIVRCSPRVVAVALSSQIYCFDALTLENKFSVLTYPMQGLVGTNVGLGPLAVGPRWLAYASNNPISLNSGRLSPQNLASSPGVSPSTSPISGNLVARYGVESSKQLAAGIINLGDMGYKTLSKYCQDLLPDGSNSPASGFGWKSGRFGSAAQMSEGDNAGVVLIKDFVSKEVISQFRAHSSPISALCFDPSGTILVTASVNGNNLNVFRITPNRHSYDSATSYVHLYKLYRGMTSAIIQDISFSHYSQWVAVVSSHGTCHIYVMSPFGGNVVLQAQSSHTNGPSLVPSLSRPWWSTWTSTKDQNFLLPPVLLSVISRIKEGNSGWLSTASSIATSATGKVPTPSGALAAVFQGSINSNPKALEHLLVCSPSGHLVQYELLPSSMAESHKSSLKLGAEPILQTQDEELRVNAAQIQWWDVRRRSNDRCDDDHDHDHVDMSADAAAKDFGRNHEKSQWYFSNAEVHVSSGRVPMWQRSKVRFDSMNSPSAESFICHGDGGEIEIESISVGEVETKRKDLLPVFGRQREHIGITDPTGSVQVGEKPLSNGITEHPEGALHERQISGRTREIPSLMKVGSPAEAPSGTRVSYADGSAITVDHSWINGQNMIADDDDDGTINIGSAGASRDFSSYAREAYCEELGVEGSSVEVAPDADNDDPSMGAIFPFEGENLNDRRSGFTDKRI